MELTRLPNSIRKRDGQVVPFEPERLSRSLFAATEALGAPDAFLARELADGVIHFLAGELHDEPPTSTQLAELVVKVVRELGHPARPRPMTNAGEFSQEPRHERQPCLTNRRPAILSKSSRRQPATT